MFYGRVNDAFDEIARTSVSGSKIFEKTYGLVAESDSIVNTIAANLVFYR